MTSRARLILIGVALVSLLLTDTASVLARAGSGGSRGSRSYSTPARPSSPASPTTPSSPSPALSQPSPPRRRPSRLVVRGSAAGGWAEGGLRQLGGWRRGRGQERGKRCVHAGGGRPPPGPVGPAPGRAGDEPRRADPDRECGCQRGVAGGRP